MNENKQYGILTTVGIDRVGIVADVSEFLGTHDSNIEVQVSSTMGAHFVASFQFSAKSAAMAAIAATYENRLRHLHPKLIPTAAPKFEQRSDSEITARVSLLAVHDTPRILMTVTKLLSERQINIITCAAAVYPMPFSGSSSCFGAELHLAIPNTALLRWLTNTFAALESRYGWEFDVKVDADDDVETGSNVGSCIPYPPSRLVERVSAKSSDFTDREYKVRIN